LSSSLLDESRLRRLVSTLRAEEPLAGAFLLLRADFLRDFSSDSELELLDSSLLKKKLS
jgi:hypothetical protein